MSRSCVHVYVHFVWRTWDSLAIIDSRWEERLHACIAEAARQIGCNALRVGGTVGHVHVLVRLTPTVTIADVAKQMQGSSAHFVTHVLARDDFFKWQGTYGAFSIGPNAIDSVIDNVDNQRERHALNDIVPHWELCDERDSDSESA